MSIKPSHSLIERKQKVSLLDSALGEPISRLQQISDSQVFTTVVCEIEKDLRSEIGFGFCLTRDRNIIQEVEKGGPAELAGLQPRDRVVKVNDIPVTFKPHDEVASLIRANSKVSLEVNRYIGGKRRTGFSVPETSAKEISLSLTHSPTEIQPDPFHIEKVIKEDQSSGEKKQQSTPALNTISMTSNPIAKRSKSTLLTERPQSYHPESKSKKKNNKTPSSHKLDSLDAPAAVGRRSPMNHSNENLSFAGPHKPMESAAPNKIVGRNFDDDDEDLQNDEDMKLNDSINANCELFSRSETVVSSPLLCAVLIKSRNANEIAPLLFYLCAQDFKRLIQHGPKELREKGRRLANEIFTTFLLDKSPLYIRLPNCLLETIRVDLFVSSNLETIEHVFDKTLEDILNLIQVECDDMCEKIRHGMLHNLTGDQEELRTNMTRDEELFQFDRIVFEKVKMIQDMEGPDGLNNLDKAYLISLATVRRYFYEDHTWGGVRSKDGPGNQPNGISGFKSMSLRVGRSMENISVGSCAQINNYWKNIATFTTKIKKSMFRRRDKQSFKGHALQERHFEEPTECKGCDLILWGVGPQGFACSNCGIAAHIQCKNRLTECNRDKKNTKTNLYKGRANSTFHSMSCEDHKGHGHILDSQSSSQSQMIPETPSALKSNALYPTQPPNSYAKVSPTDGGFFPSKQYDSMPNFSQMSTPNYQSSVSVPHGSASFNYTITGEEEHEDSSDFSATPDLNKSVATGDVVAIFDEKECLDDNQLNDKNPRHSTLPNIRKAGYVSSLVDKFGGGTSPSPSRGSRLSDASLYDSISINKSAVDISREIVESWEGDEDMNVRSSFDAEFEFKQFPDFKMPESQKDESYRRLLVLMEFHHKIRFLVQYIKSFDYFLVKRWPDSPDAKELKSILALDCIHPLLELFKSLAEKLDKCRESTTYSPRFGEEIYDWMTRDNESNMTGWLINCSQLVACNTLKEVPILLRSYKRKDPNLATVLSLKHNKFNKVESLGQTRTFLFSLPMIAATVHKTLTEKTTSFKDEGLVWEKILVRCNALPKYMNVITLPLVNLMNNNQIISIMSEEYKDHKYKDFPKSIFRRPVLAQTKVHLDQQSVSIDKQGFVQGVDLKNDVEALALLYKEEIVILVRESDKFVLKIKLKSKSVYPLDSFHLPQPGVEKSGPYVLKVIFIEDKRPSLLQIQFDTKDDRDAWMSLLNQIKTHNQKSRPVEMFLCLELLHSVSEEPVATPLDTSLSDEKSITDKKFSSTIEETDESNTNGDADSSTRVNELKHSLKEVRDQFSFLMLDDGIGGAGEEDSILELSLEATSSSDYLSKFMLGSLENCSIVADIIATRAILEYESEDDSSMDHKALKISAEQFDRMERQLENQSHYLSRLREEMIKCQKQESTKHCNVPNAPSIESMPDEETVGGSTPINRSSSSSTSTDPDKDEKIIEFARQFISDIIGKASKICAEQKLQKEFGREEEPLNPDLSPEDPNVMIMESSNPRSSLA